MKVKKASGKICIHRYLKKGLPDAAYRKFFEDLNALGWHIVGFWNECGEYVAVSGGSYA